MEFGQLIEPNMRIVILEKSYTKYGLGLDLVNLSHFLNDF